MQPRERLIFPLDVPNKTAAERFISRLKDHVGLFKVGLELFVAEGPGFLQFLTETARVDYFLDLKFHDIPATVRSALSRIMAGARLATVHVDTGRESLKLSPGARENEVQPPSVSFSIFSVKKPIISSSIRQNVISCKDVVCEARKEKTSWTMMNAHLSLGKPNIPALIAGMERLLNDLSEASFKVLYTVSFSFFSSLPSPQRGPTA